MPERLVEIVNGAHFYQPDRRSYHDNLKDIQTSPDFVDWTDIGRMRVYRQLGNLGLYNSLSYDLAPPLRRELSRLEKDYRAHDPETAADVRQTIARMEQPLAENGIATTAVHAIQPHVSTTDKHILVQAGIQDYREVAGQNPLTFWLPEGGVDTETLDVLALNGLRAFICAPEQISASSPRRIKLSDDREIVAVPFNSTISRELAFDRDRRSDARAFVERIIKPIADWKRITSDDSPIVVFADGETYGMYDPQKETDPDAPGSDRFLEYEVLHALPDVGVKVISINALVRRFMENPGSIPEGQINQQTAWSCSNGLVRWNGEGNCGESSGAEWKFPFYIAHAQLNHDVTELVRTELGLAGEMNDEVFVRTVVAAFRPAFVNPGGQASTPERSLISAKTAALAARASCGTFYDHPGVSGGQNIVFARTAVEHLFDAGLAEPAQKIWDTYIQNMEQLPDSYGKGDTGGPRVPWVLDNRQTAR